MTFDHNGGPPETPPADVLNGNGEREEASLVLAERVRTVYSSRVVMIVQPINAVIIVAVLYGEIARAPMFVWLGAVVLVSAIRLILARAFDKSDAMPEEMGLWSALHALGAGAAGLLWASSAAIIVLVDPMAYHALIAVVIAGMTAGALAVSAAHLPSFYAFALPANGALAAAFLIRAGTTHIAMAGMTLLFMVMIVLIARNWSRTVSHSMSLMVHNARLVEDLREARDRAEGASRVKSQILANMSHEFRTPLNAIIGFSETMKREILGPIGSERYRGYVEDIHNSGTHLLNLVNDILDLAKIESGKYELYEENVDVVRIVEESIRMVEASARAAEVSVTDSLQERLPALYADERSLRQILLNLLSNAIKFTPSGGTVTVAAHIATGGDFVLSVADTGIGMSEDYLESATQPFDQAYGAMNRDHAGTGLGLSLTKHLVEMHDGRLLLESALGKGTTVTARFPWRRVLQAVYAAE